MNLSFTCSKLLVKILAAYKSSDILWTFYTNNNKLGG